MTVRTSVVDDQPPPAANAPAVSQLPAVPLSASARTAAWAALLGATIVALIGVPMSFALNIWLDEAFTLHTTAAGPAYAWSSAIQFEGQAPLYFLIESIWRWGNEQSIGYARLPSIAFAALAVAVTVRAAWRIVPRIPPLVVALLTAFNPIVLWYASELRLYALLLLLGAGLTATFYDGFLAARTSQRARVWYVVCAVAGLYTQYYIGFVLAAQLLTIIALRRSALRNIAVALGCVAVAFAPYASIPITQIDVSGDFVNHLPLSGALHQLGIAIFIFLLPHDGHWIGPAKYTGYVCAAALFVLVLGVGRPRLSGDPALRAVTVSWILTSVLLVAVFTVSGTPYDISRHIIFLMPPSLIVALLVLASVSRWRSVVWGAAIVAAVAFTDAGLWYRYHPPLGKLGDWQRIAQTIEAEDRTAPVAIYTAENELPLRVYLSRPATAVPRSIPFNLGYVGAMDVHSTSEVASVLDSVRARAPRLWFVESEIGDAASGVSYVYAYLDRYYRLERDIAFDGASASLYIRR